MKQQLGGYLKIKQQPEVHASKKVAEIVGPSYLSFTHGIHKQAHAASRPMSIHHQASSPEPMRIHRGNEAENLFIQWYKR